MRDRGGGRFSKQDLAYAWIRERIETGEYGPGRRLIIDSLAERLQISQVPIREALRKLEAEGWVRYQRNTGPEVANVSLEQWRATMQFLAVQEGYATALAAGSLRRQDLRDLRRENAAMARALDDLDLYAVSQRNRSFHSVIYRSCPNELLVEVIIATQARLDAIRGTLFPHVPVRGQASIDEHSHLIELLERPASFDEIERSARQHKLSFLEVASERLARPMAGAGPL